MQRQQWLVEKRRLAEERYNTLWAPSYDQDWGKIGPIHQAYMTTLLDRCPPGCTILDAACGTGKYWPIIRASGRAVIGIDQSQAMLDQAHAKFPTVPVRKAGLQELTDEQAFDAIICVDAMENVFPEDWPLVLRNFQRALRPDGLLYLTVELADASATQSAFEQGQRQGLPVVYGEWGHEGGYHYYPAIEQVWRWLDEAHLTVLDQAADEHYHHFIVRN